MNVELLPEWMKSVERMKKGIRLFDPIERDLHVWEMRRNYGSDLEWRRHLRAARYGARIWMDYAAGRTTKADLRQRVDEYCRQFPNLKGEIDNVFAAFRKPNKAT